MNMFIVLAFYLHAKSLYGCIISTRGEIWSHKTSLTLSLFIEFLVPIQQSEQSCNLCVKDIDFTFSFDFISFFFRRGILGKDLLHCRGSLNNFSYSKNKT